MGRERGTAGLRSQGADALQGPEGGSGRGHSRPWLGSRSGSHPASLFSFVGGSPVGRDCGVEAGKPSNPFSFMRPFLGSRPATADLSLLFVCAGEN